MSELTDTLFAVFPVLYICAAWECEFGHHRPTLLWEKDMGEKSLGKHINNIQFSGFPQTPFLSQVLYVYRLI